MNKLLFKGRMTLKELQHLKNANELEVIHKMQDLLRNAEKAAKKVVAGSKMPRVELRKNMNDMRLLCMIMRDMVKMRNSGEQVNKTLEAAIRQEINSIERENRRKNLASDEVVQAQLEKMILSEKIKRENREQKTKEGEGSNHSKDQKAEGEL